MELVIDFMDKQVDIKTYRTMKIQMLHKDFCINLSEEEKQHINSLKTEIAIDQFCRTLIKRALD